MRAHIVLISCFVIVFLSPFFDLFVRLPIFVAAELGGEPRFRFLEVADVRIDKVIDLVAIKIEGVLQGER